MPTPWHHPGGATDRHVLETLVRSELAQALGLASDAIDAAAPLSALGLESLQVTSLMARLSERVGRTLSPVLLWRYPTLRALVDHLVAEVPAERGPSAVATTHDGREPIAIVGIGCRFPGGANTPEALWTLLTHGVDTIHPIPAERWDTDAFYDADPGRPGTMNVREGGFLDRVDAFDPTFFGIAPREAEQMDPQQRLVLEVAWEALEDAGIPPSTLAGTPTGVAVGAVWSDWALLQQQHLGRAGISSFTATGYHHSIIANRVSYVLGLQGPSLAIDTACSSSLVAIHVACQQLRSGEASMMLVGGVNLMLAPESTVALTKFGALSPGGRCRTFAAGADGYSRGEGAAMVVLKTLRRARSDGDRVYAVIAGSAVNNDGASNGLTAPNPVAQESVIRAALEAAGVVAHDVDYVELHGTGTPLGDPIEASALAQVVAGPDRDTPLLVGSVKTNLGHLEAAAGIAGLIKTALAIHHREVPPSLHFDTPNPHIDLGALRLEVPTRARPWSSVDRIAGVSSFGFGGTNAHTILRASPQRVLRGRPSMAVGGARGPVFVCSGLGPRWNGMGRELLANVPSFRTAFEECDALVQEFAGWSMIDLLFGPEDLEALEYRDRHDLLHPLLVSLVISAAAMWRALGVVPAATLGHSIGEIAAAEVCGALPRREAIRTAVAVGSIYRESVEASGGLMAYVGLDAARLRIALRQRDGRVAVVGDNEPGSCVLCGPPEDLEPLLARLEGHGVMCRVLSHVRAHCDLVAPFSKDLTARLAGLTPRRAEVPMWSTALNRWLDGTELGAEYWRHNVEQPVRFREGIEQLAREGHTDFLELGAHPVLSRSIEKTCAAVSSPCTVYVTEHRDRPGAAWTTLSALEEAGLVAKTEVDTPVLVPLSGATPAALHDNARRLLAWVGSHDCELVDVATTLARHREHFAHRLAIVVRSRAELCERLAAFLEGEVLDGVVTGKARPHGPRIALVFPGQGSQWLGMGRELSRRAPVFRETLERCDAAILAVAGWSVLAELDASETDSRLTQVQVVQPLLFAIQVALASLLRSFGVEPEVVLGHSMGEVAAAVAANALSLADGAAVICERSRLVARHASGRGGLALVALSAPEAQRRLAVFGGALTLGVHNGPNSVVISGDKGALDALLEALAADGVWARLVNVDYASHSHHMDPLAGQLRTALAGIRPREAKTTFFSTVSVGALDGPELDADYWVDNLRDPVRFSEAITTLSRRGLDTFVEVSAHPVLVHALHQNLDPIAAHTCITGSGHRNDEWRSLVVALGALWVHGASPRWTELLPAGGHRLDLPRYAWQHERYWLSPRVDTKTQRLPADLLLGEPLTSPALDGLVFATAWSVDAAPWLRESELLGVPVVSVGVIIAGLGALAQAVSGAEALELHALEFKRPLVLRDRPISVQWVASPRGPATSLTLFAWLDETWSSIASARLDRTSPGPRSSARLDPSLFTAALSTHFGPQAGVDTLVLPTQVARVHIARTDLSGAELRVTTHQDPREPNRSISRFEWRAPGGHDDLVLLTLEEVETRRVPTRDLARLLGVEGTPARGADELQQAMTAKAALRDDPRALLEHVRARVARILGFRSNHPLDVEVGLKELGLTSLAAIELRDRLAEDFALDLPTTLAFDYPTILAITGLIGERLGRAAHARAKAPVEVTDDLDGLSEDELAMLLNATVRDLEGAP